MSDEEKKPEEEKKAEEAEDKKEEEKEKSEDNGDKKENKEEDKEKASSVIDALKSVTEAIEKLDSKISKQDERIKAMETPTDLPLKPKLSDSEDIGDDTKVPDTYQSNSQQAGIDDSDPKNEVPKDEKKLEMQEKRNVNKSEKVEKASPEHTYTTESPRPGSGTTQDILKANDLEPNPVLEAARKVGYEGLSLVAKDIRSGKYIEEPTQLERIRHW